MKKIFCIGTIIAVLGFLVIGLMYKWESEMVSPYFLFLTLVAILWYSSESRDMKHQMVLQNELTLRPRLSLLGLLGFAFA